MPEEALQAGGPGVFLGGGVLGNGVEMGVPPPAVYVVLLGAEEGLQTLHKPGLSRGGHIGHRLPVKVLHLGPAVTAKPAPDQQLENAVAHMGQPQGRNPIHLPLVHGHGKIILHNPSPPWEVSPTLYTSR